MGHRGGARRDPLGGEWFGKFLSVRKLPECDPQAEASLALVADAQSTVLGETDLKTSGLHLIDQVMLGVASAVVARRGTGIYLPAQHDSRWKTGLAQAQGRAHDLSRAAAKQSPVGVVPFLESLCLSSLLFKDAMICVKPTTVSNRIHADLACASLGPAMVSDSQISWSDWGAVLESVSLPTAEVSLLMWARTGDFQRVLPQGAYWWCCPGRPTC